MVKRVQPICTILVKSQSFVVAHTKLSKYQSWKSKYYEGINTPKCQFVFKIPY